MTSPSIKLETALAGVPNLTEYVASLLPPSLGAVLLSFADVTMRIGDLLRSAPLGQMLNQTGRKNVYGDRVLRLDEWADREFLKAFGACPYVAGMASEEQEHLVDFLRPQGAGNYIVGLDPLDGGSNAPINGCTGSFLSVWKTSDFTQREAGSHLVAAALVVYGPATMLVIATPGNVDGFVLEPSANDFLLWRTDIRLPETGATYSTNDGYLDKVDGMYRDYVNLLRGRGYSSRYVGSLVADVLRTLLTGGVFFYPATASAKKGKLRLLFEAIPCAFIVEQSGGVATDGERRILDIKPGQGVDERTPLLLGGRAELVAFEGLKHGTSD